MVGRLIGFPPLIEPLKDNTSDGVAAAVAIAVIEYVEPITFVVVRLVLFRVI